MKSKAIIFLLALSLLIPLVLIKAATPNNLNGKILLQVESKGEAWYVNPKDGKRHYMANGDQAFQIMKTLGSGMSNKDIEKMKTDAIYRKKFIGKILLQVQSHGEAYYISSDGRYNYLKDGASAYQVMRKLGLGISNANLNKIAEYKTQTNSSLSNSKNTSAPNNLNASKTSSGGNVQVETPLKSSLATTETIGQITYKNSIYNCDVINNKDLCVYNVVKICDKDKKYCQEWLKENLNVGQYVLSNASVSSDCANIGTSSVPAWSCQGSSGVQKYCYSTWGKNGGNETNCQTSGSLYEWAEAMGLPKECNNSAFDKSGKSLSEDCKVTLSSKTQGICPNGFHIPSKQEWLQLARNTINDQSCDMRDYSDGIGGCAPSGHKLKKRNNIVDIGGVANGSGSGCDNSMRNDGSEKDDTDCGSANFDALFGGIRNDITGTFEARGYLAFFWSATPSESTSTLTNPFAYTSSFVNGQRTTQDSEVGKTNGLSVRCIKD